MERKNELGLEAEDLENIDMVVEALMDSLAVLNSTEYDNENIVELNDALGFASFTIAGIIYKHGLDMCAGHDHDDEDDDDA